MTKELVPEDDFIHIVRAEESFINLDDDVEKGVNLRPQFLSDFIGQDGVKKNLEIFIDAAKKDKKLLIIFF